MSNEEIRAAAIKRINQKRAFWRLLGVFVIVMIMLTAIWALSGAGYYWPAWAAFGMGVALLFTGWAAFGPGEKPVTEQQISDEMRKLGDQ
ncbi:MAG: 2TM domain-containing protein [Candidatus Nanopelagicales bacterium]